MQRKNSKSSTFPGAHGALGHHAAVLETRPSVAEAPAARKLPPPRAVELPPPTPKTEVCSSFCRLVMNQRRRDEQEEGKVTNMSARNENDNENEKNGGK